MNMVKPRSPVYKTLT